MILYITFGDDHPHTIMSKEVKIVINSNTIVGIECNSFEHGRSIANLLFGDKFAFSYDDMKEVKKIIFRYGYTEIILYRPVLSQLIYEALRNESES